MYAKNSNICVCKYVSNKIHYHSSARSLIVKMADTDGKHTKGKQTFLKI
jgi:hypothetical protein